MHNSKPVRSTSHVISPGGKPGNAQIKGVKNQEWEGNEGRCRLQTRHQRGLVTWGLTNNGQTLVRRTGKCAARQLTAGVTPGRSAGSHARPPAPHSSLQLVQCHPNTRPHSCTSLHHSLDSYLLETSS
ncbi:hypothetical protein KC19_3G229700 [Ceratodon purpureus]|uniref:Uncharacterized protein n=1 Tax=Ceratodon purpureus TaxID=3225 RepID=A0A8T0IQQ4_CERPU|nr:hypothetical protein KC19_3G229700 [Ceratodon purpureus]